MQRKTLILLVLAILGPARPAISEVPPRSADQGPSFAVDTRVYVGDSSRATGKTTTVFHQRLAYDVVEGRHEAVAKFDFVDESVRLVDRDNRVVSTIPFTDMLRFQAELRARAEKRGGLGAFFADPSFIREFDASKSTITLSSPWITYVAEGHQSASDSVEQFLEFADWAARLASMLHPSAPPAKARIELNKAIRNQNWQVTRVIRRGGPHAKMMGEIRSEHDYRTTINDQDRLLIQLVEKNLRSFKQISFSEFRRLQKSPRVATNK